MRYSYRVLLVICGCAGSLLLFGVFMMAAAVPRKSQPDAPLTGEKWAVLSNTALNWQHIRVAAAPNDRLFEPAKNDFRKLLKLLMPFEATSEPPGDRFDYELVYQGGMDPTTIYVDVAGDDMRFWFRGRPTLYRSRSREAWLKALESLVPQDSSQRN
jgi:hypothetical protein